MWPALLSKCGISSMYLCLVYSFDFSPYFYIFRVFRFQLLKRSPGQPLDEIPVKENNSKPNQGIIISC